MRAITRPIAVAVLLALGLLVGACGDDDDGGGSSAAAPASSAATIAGAASSDAASVSTAGSTDAAAAEADQSASSSTDAAGDGGGTSAANGDEPLNVTTGADGCSHVEPPTAGGDRRNYDAPPPSGLPGGAAGTVQLQTSCGPIAIELDTEVGGAVADAFAGLVRDGFYDGLAFHRVVPDFVIQGGDPEGSGAGGPGFSVTQAPPASYVYAKGDVAMAKLPTDPAGTAGSQFFIVVSPQGAAGLGAPGDQPLYAVVGHVLDQQSLKTVARIAALGVGDGAPVEPVWIWQATVEQG